MCRTVLADATYLSDAQRAIPPEFRVAGGTTHPNFLTVDFALVEGISGDFEPQLVEIQAFPSLFAYQASLNAVYQAAFSLDSGLRYFLSGLNESSYWELLRHTIIGEHAPENVVLTEVEPELQKTRPDFILTAQRLGISVIDIRDLFSQGDSLMYRNREGKKIRAERIYNRAIADEMMARKIRAGVDLSRSWDVEWSGHPDWYFLISKFSIPKLAAEVGPSLVPPAVFLDDFLDGAGERQLRDAGVELPDQSESNPVYMELLLKPLFSFAGRGIEFAPDRDRLRQIATEERRNYLLQKRMRFAATIQTPCGMTQAEIRILYLWPDGGELTPVLPLVRLGRGKMMGVDHNRDLEWVGASAAFYPGT